MTKQRYYLQEWRDYKALSQEQLAARSGVDASTISKMETDPYGRRQGRVIHDLAKALGIDPEDMRGMPYAKESAKSGTVQPKSEPIPNLRELLKGGKFEFEGKVYLMEGENLETVIKIILAVATQASKG